MKVLTKKNLYWSRHTVNIWTGLTVKLLTALSVMPYEKEVPTSRTEKHRLLPMFKGKKRFYLDTLHFT